LLLLLLLLTAVAAAAAAVASEGGRDFTTSSRLVEEDDCGGGGGFASSDVSAADEGSVGCWTAVSAEEVMIIITQSDYIYTICISFAPTTTNVGD
jgi:hypothetical protein